MQFQDSELTEVQVSSEEIFHGKIVHLFRDQVRLPNGKVTTREVMRHPGAAAGSDSARARINLNAGGGWCGPNACLGQWRARPGRSICQVEQKGGGHP